MRLLFLLISLLCISPVWADDDDVPSYSEEGFQSWLKNFKDDAFRQGISPSVLDDAFGSSTLDARVLELDRKQPESKFTIGQYLDRVITKKRIEDGRAQFIEHRKQLGEIGKKYGVQPKFIVALWGIETNYGT